jgi:hypothetical protein
LYFGGKKPIIPCIKQRNSDMTRISKKEERRAQSPRRCRFPSPKTGPLKDNLPKGFKEQTNALTGEQAKTVFIGKVQ